MGARRYRQRRVSFPASWLRNRRTDEPAHPLYPGARRGGEAASGEASGCGNQLRQVWEENRTRQAAVVDMGQLRDQLARRQTEEAARRQEAKEKKLLAEVEAEFIGKRTIGRDAILSRWRALARREIPDPAAEIAVAAAAVGVGNITAPPKLSRGVDFLAFELLAFRTCAGSPQTNPIRPTCKTSPLPDTTTASTRPFEACTPKTVGSTSPSRETVVAPLQPQRGSLRAGESRPEQQVLGGTQAAAGAPPRVGRRHR